MNKKMLLIAVPLLIAACTQNSTPQSVLPSGSPTSQTLVAPKYAQTLVLKSSLDAGALTSQSVDDTQLSTVLVTDFDGQPFYYVTQRYEGPSTDSFWDALQYNAPSSVYYGNGASTDRNLFAFQYDSTFGTNLAALVKAHGVDHLVSPEGSVILLLDQSGTYWNVVTKEQVKPDDLTILKQNYQNIRDTYFSTPADIATMRNAWAESITQTDAALQEASGGISGQALNTSGNLDLRGIYRYINAHPKLHSLGSADDVASWGWFGWINSRAGIAGTGYAGPQAMSANVEAEPAWQNRYSKDFGNLQYVTTSPYWQSSALNWGMRFYNPLHGGVSTPTGIILGCVPTSFLRMVTINGWTGNLKSQIRQALQTSYHQAAATDPTGQSDVSYQANVAALYQAMSRPVQADSVPAGYVEPHMSQMFGAGEFNGGTAVDAVGTGAGARAFVTEVFGNNFQLVGSSFGALFGAQLQYSDPLYGTSGFNSLTYNVRDAVRTVIDDDNNAVSFPYSPSGVDGHETVSYAYNIYEHVGYSDVYLYLSTALNSYGYNAKEGFSTISGWINVTNRWAVTGGAYGIRSRY